MPILPLDHPDPLAATLGIMHYPGVDESERRVAATWTLNFLARPIADHRRGGGSVDHGNLLDLVTAAGADLSDLDGRRLSGRIAGEVFKTYFFLAHSHPDRASWSNARRIVTHVAAKDGKRAGRTHLKTVPAGHLPVAHLWAAASIREFRFGDDAAVGYDGVADFQSFLTEAEILRQWGETWKQPIAKAEPPLAGIDMWRPPTDWRPPIRRDGWPATGKIPHLGLDQELIDLVRPAGRPKKSD